MQKLKLRTVFIAFIMFALVSAVISVNQFSALYYAQTEQLRTLVTQFKV